MIGRIKKLELRKIWKNEATDFTTWLEENLDALGDAVGLELTLLKREHPVGSFSVDIVATDDQGHSVIIENQLEKTDHTHLGQILTYVSNLEAKTVIWISSDPRQEHVNAINWLNTHTEVNFYLLKLDAISIDGSKPAPLFQVVSKPDEDIRHAAAAANELTDRGRFHIQFWTEMNKLCVGKLPGFTFRKPLKYAFHNSASGRGGISFVFLAHKKYYAVELYIDTPSAEANLSILEQLQSQKSKIEGAFGAKLLFDDIPGKRACRIKYVIKEGVDVASPEADREQIQSELIEHMIRFEKAIKPLLKDLDYDREEAA